MRLRKRYRAFAALWSIWFLAVLTAPGLVHSCPMHDGPAGGHAGHAGHAAMSMPADHASSMAQPSKSDGGHTGHSGNVCTCLGCCCDAAPVACAPAPPTVIALVVSHDVAPVDAGAAVAHAARAYSLPFANGPPAVA